MLIGVSYLLMFDGYKYVWLINNIVIIMAYYLLVKYQTVVIVVILILSSRVLNGFLGVNGSNSYSYGIVITTYLPMLVFILLKTKKSTCFKLKDINKIKFAIIFIFYSILSFIFNINTAYPMLTKNIIPLSYFIIFSVFYYKEYQAIKITHVVIYFRVILLFSLVVYFRPDYYLVYSSLMQSGYVFGVPVVQPFSDYFGFIRNHGIFFDGRIFGIFIYTYLYVLMQSKKKIQIIEILMLSIITLTTVSRGNIIVFFGLMSIYAFKQMLFIKRVAFFLVVVLIGVLLLNNTGAVSSESLSNFISSFNIIGENNAFSQREGFSEYAIAKFTERPLFGYGLGSLTARDTIERHVKVGSVYYNTVSDAYLFTILAELGLLGFVLFLLSLIDIIISRYDILSVGFFLLFLSHMIGTDIPNISMPYFCLLLLLINSKQRVNRLQMYSANMIKSPIKKMKVMR